MYHEPQQLDRFLVRSLKRLDENDCKEAIAILKKRIADLRNPNYHLTIPLEDLPLSTKARNALLHLNLLNVKEVLAAGWEKISRERGLGPHTMHEIRTLMEKIARIKDEIKGMAGHELRSRLARREEIENPES